MSTIITGILLFSAVAMLSRIDDRLAEIVKELKRG